MKCYYLAEENGFADRDCAYPVQGFKHLGYECIPVSFSPFIGDLTEVLQELSPEDVFVGDVNSTKYVFKNNELPYPEMDTFPELNSVYYGRKIKKTICSEAFSAAEFPFFIKPVSKGIFTPCVIENSGDRIGLMHVNEKTPVYIQEVIHFIKEWRVFVSKQEDHLSVQDVRGYTSPKCLTPSSPSMQILGEIILDLYHRGITPFPDSFCMDVGVDKEGNTFIVEFNSGLCAAGYGLDPLTHALRIKSLWEEAWRKKEKC